MQAAPGSAFFVGQLVQVRGADGSFGQLARVWDLEVTPGAPLTYLCRHVPDGWGFPDTRAAS